MYENVDITDLVGKTITEIHNSGDELTINCSDGSAYKMYHDQDCCESVSIEDINGDILDLIGLPVLEAEERDGEGLSAIDEWDESFTWTFYIIRNVKASVTIRWYGSSNGYYSESVSFVKL